MPLFLLRFGSWWSSKAWPWLKENWLLVVLFPLGLLALGGIKRRPKVVSTELSGADEVEREARAARDEGVAEAQEDHAEEVAEALEERDEDVGGLVTDQERRAENPPEGENLTDFLKDVGKDVRR